MKKLIAVAILTLISSATPTNTTIVDKTDISQSVGMPNPFVKCDTIEDAQEIAGFSMTLPVDIPDGYEKMKLRAIKDSLIDVKYISADDELIIRKGMGTDDISGDYNIYSTQSTKEISDNNVTLKMKGDKVYTALWNDGTYAYAISCDFDSKGLDMDTTTKLISELK